MPKLHLVFFLLLQAVPVISIAFEYPFTESSETTTIKDPDRPATVQVNAVDRFWRSSGVLLEAGNTYLITAEGQWQLGGLCNPTGPDGISPYTIACWDLGPTTRTVGEVSHAALIGRIGHAGVPFAIGNSKELVPDKSGILYLMVNEHPDFFFDNTGFVKAKVRMLHSSAPQPVAPTPETTEIIIKQETPESTNTIQIKRGGGGGGGRGPE